MRAAQTALRRPMLPRRQAAERPRKESGEKTFDVAWLLGMLFLLVICRAYGWAGAVPRRWGSSWRPTTKKARRKRPLCSSFGRSLRLIFCS